MLLPLLLAPRRHLVVSIQPGSLPQHPALSLGSRLSLLLLHAPWSSSSSSSTASGGWQEGKAEVLRTATERGWLHACLGWSSTLALLKKNKAADWWTIDELLCPSRNQSVRYLSLPRLWRHPYVIRGHIYPHAIKERNQSTSMGASMGAIYNKLKNMW